MKTEENSGSINSESQKERIRQMTGYQQSLSSSSLSSSAASCSSFSSSCRSRSSLLHLMKRGNSSFGRLFEMEHTSLATHFQDYGGPPLIKTIPLWGSGTDKEMCDPRADIREIGTLNNGLGIDKASQFALEGSFIDGQFRIVGRRRLEKKKSFRRLPRMWLCRFRGFRFRSRLRRLQILIRAKTF